jgi:hypothetical protein
MNKKIQSILPSSFRDPDGYLFYHNKILYRQVNKSYKENYDHLIRSGLYEKLVNKKLLIPHKETNLKAIKLALSAYKIICPEVIPFISYSYEWCFSELKDAAIATLKIQKTALEYNMSLKDSSAFNIQFYNGSPILIDTLSFEIYNSNFPWSGYRQFCQHFVAPLALMSYINLRLGQLSRIYIDGIPLNLASSLLPLRTKFSFGLLTHIHLHAISQKKYENKSIKTGAFSKTSMLALIENLETTINNLTWNMKKSEWSDYYLNMNNYTNNAFEEKKIIVSKFIKKIKPSQVWDFGANVGMFSRLPAEQKIKTISFDIDPICAENNYLKCKSQGERNILPLLLDIINPTPAIGWANDERLSLTGRGPVDCIMALAILHHLAIGNNLPLKKIAEYFAKICHTLIIEFIPKSDTQVLHMLVNRKDIFPDYTQQNFEKVFKKYFKIIDKVSIRNSERILYLMKV